MGAIASLAAVKVVNRLKPTVFEFVTYKKEYVYLLGNMPEDGVFNSV